MYYYYGRDRRRRFGGVAYLLRDQFDGALAAGSVNGTLAEPGPGTRTVVDTNNKLSIAGGQLSIATGGVGAPDPRIRYDAQTRVAGLILMCSTTVTTEGIRFAFSDAVGAARQNAIRLEALNITIDYDSSNFLVVGSYVLATAYQLAIRMRASGKQYFIKGGAFTNWTLLFVGANRNTATLYPFISGDDNDSVLTADDIGVPDVIFTMMPLVSDAFTRANGALGTTGGGAVEEEGGAGLTWNNRVGTTLIAANVASASALVGGIAIATVDTDTVDTIVNATLARVGNEVGVVLRYVDVDNYVRAIHDGTNCKLIKRVAGVENDVISAVVAFGAGAVVVVPDGTLFSLYLNNAKIGATSTINDAALQTGTEVGLYSTNVGNSQDDLAAWARGTGGEYAELERW